MTTPATIELRADDRALFASDVHLDDHAPRTAAMFLAALAEHAGTATHLFLLGDLFEAWVGDDRPDAAASRAIDAIAALAARGLRVFAMRGNRDFLLDVPMPGRAGAPGFATRLGATMLDDPCAVSLFGRATLLAHGDALCTDDQDYQRFRTLIRTPQWQQAFLARTAEERDAVARDLRARSELSKGEKADYLMDVNAAAVERAMREAGARLLIHGHTHRPACHALRIDGEDAQRWVLPDWDAAEGRGGMLLASAAGFERLGRWGPSG